jgi:hypothetical protein
LIDECYLAKWEAWAVVHKMVSRGILKEEGALKRHYVEGSKRGSKAIAVKTFALTELGKSLFSG